MADPERPANDEHGLTDEDRAQIAAYLQQPPHTRSVDDLRRRTDQ